MIGSLWREGRRLGALGWLGLSEWFLHAVGRRPPFSILKINLSGNLAEEESEQRLLGFLRRPAADFLGLIGMLRWARTDPRLSAVLISCGELNAGWARLQELRRSITLLRQAGKRVWVHLNDPGVHEYYLATAAERISVAPAAMLDVTGLATESVFFLGALEKVGVRAEVVQVGRYKAAVEPFTRTDMSAEHREMMEALVDDLYGQIVDGIAAGRSMDPPAVRDVLDRGPFLSREAVQAGLIDAAAYEDEIETRLLSESGGGTVIDGDDYSHRRGREMSREVLRLPPASVGLLHIGGTIKSGDSIPGPDGANASGAATVADALKEMRERDDVRAVVVRVASPGGSGLASDLMWREVTRTREKKPVVVSFGDVAASGGYYLAVAGAPLFAEPGTITGSIGVVAGKADLRGLYDRLGVTKDLVKRGRHSTIHSDYVPLSDEERARIRVEAENFYREFVDKVAAARRLTPEATDAAAQGRVWTGRQALSRGLVDELGGLDEAVDTARRLAGMPVEGPAAIERFPRPRRLWKLSFDLNLPTQGRLPGSQLAALFTHLPAFAFVLRERVWALMPFGLRFR